MHHILIPHNHSPPHPIIPLLLLFRRTIFILHRTFSPLSLQHTFITINNRIFRLCQLISDFDEFGAELDLERVLGRGVGGEGGLFVEVDVDDGTLLYEVEFWVVFQKVFSCFFFLFKLLQYKDYLNLPAIQQHVLQKPP